MLPQRGPMLYSVQGAQGLAVAAAVGAVPGTSAVLRFRWPRALFCTGVALIARTGLASDLSTLALRIQDESFQDVIADGRGAVTIPIGVLGGPQGMGGPGVLVTPGNAWLALQRPVTDGDLWFFTITNASAGILTVAALLLRFEEGLRRAG